MTRREIVKVLLSTLNDVREVLQRNEIPGGDSWGLEMPKIYREGSYAELEWTLKHMRTVQRHLWWHVNERYVTPERFTAWICPECRRLTDLNQLAPAQLARIMEGTVYADGSRHEPPRARWHVHVVERQIRPVKPVWGRHERWHEKVNLALVEDGITWLEQWMPDRIWLPDEIAKIHAA